MTLFSGSNAFWSAFNNEYLIDKIKILNKRNNGFFSPYTKTQILKFITKLCELYRF